MLKFVTDAINKGTICTFGRERGEFVYSPTSLWNVADGKNFRYSNFFEIFCWIWNWTHNQRTYETRPWEYESKVYPGILVTCVDFSKNQGNISMAKEQTSTRLHTLWKKLPYEMMPLRVDPTLLSGNYKRARKCRWRFWIYTSCHKGKRLFTMERHIKQEWKLHSNHNYSEEDKLWRLSLTGHIINSSYVD